MKKFFAISTAPKNYHAAIAFLRFIAGIAMMHHGWGKIQNPLHWMGADSEIPSFLQALAAVSEFFGGLFVAIGLLTPIAAFGVLCTMAYAVYKHAIIGGHAFVGKPSYELASLYFAIMLLVLLVGAGNVSVDYLLFGSKAKR